MCEQVRQPVGRPSATAEAHSLSPESAKGAGRGILFLMVFGFTALWFSILSASTFGSIWMVARTEVHWRGDIETDCIYVHLFSFTVDEQSDRGSVRHYASLFGSHLSWAGWGSALLTLGAIGLVMAVCAIGRASGRQLKRRIIFGLGLAVLAAYLLHIVAMLALNARDVQSTLRPDWVLGFVGASAVVIAALGSSVPAIQRFLDKLLRLAPGGELKRKSPLAHAFLLSLACTLGLRILLVPLDFVGGVSTKEPTRWMQTNSI